ncbi:MAG: tRNA dihydrouridine synthase DusB [Myxococcota bacterium]
MVMRIGPHLIDPPYLLAPMASVSEMPFRVLAFEMGAGLATTELISAKGIFYGNRRTRQYMTFDRERERPYSLQLFGGDVEAMAVAARAAWEHGADIVDINMGCPVKKVTKTGSGSSLMCDPHRAAALVTAMRKATEDRIPITAKLRAGWDKDTITCTTVARALEDAGCAAVALHPRTRAQGYSGDADWSLIRALKESVSIPVIGNGDVNSFADAQRMFAETGCDAVMIGRGALGNPWIFASLKAGRDLGAPSPDERLRLIRRHLAAHVDFHASLDGSEEERRRHRLAPEEQAVRTFRQHLVWYSRGVQGGAAFRSRAMQLDSAAAVDEAIEEFFGALRDGDALARFEEAEGVDYRQAFG